MQEIYEKIKALLQENKEFVLATVVNAESSTSGKRGFKMIILPDGTAFGTVGGGVFEKDVIEHAKELFKTHGTLFKTYILKEGEESSLGMVCGGKIQIYMEYIGNKPQLIIFGAGHIGKKLHDILSLDDTFDLIVCDNRKDFANTERFPNAAIYNAENFEASIKEMNIKDGAFVIIVTAGGKDDPVILKGLYDKHVRYNYIGMIGSLNRKNKCFVESRKLGVEDTFLNKIFAPIGLAINSETPFEIAIAIIGEIIAVRKGALKNIMTEKEAHNESI